MRFFYTVILLLINFTLSAQIKQVEQPTFKSFEPISTTTSGSTNNYGQNNNRVLSPAEQSNYALIGQSTSSADQKRKEYALFLREERQEEIKQQFLLLKNKSTDSSKINEVNALKSKLRLANYNSSVYISKSKYYFSAAQELKQMLEGKTPINLKRAVFCVENAWYGNTKTYKHFCNSINQLTWLCKEVLHQENKTESDIQACHQAIQKIYMDTIFVKKADGTIKIFPPLKYDFNDFFGAKNYSKLFVTKLLETKSGQCHSLPLLYLILAKELNVDAYLAIAPNHSYVKYPIGSNMYSFECTSAQKVSDSWMVASGYISSMAIKNGIYLAPLTQKEAVAQCLNDLCNEYQHEFGFDDFVLLQSQLSIKHYPMGISAMLNISNCVTAYCFFMAEKYKFPPLEKMNQYPELKKRYELMLDLEKDIDALGYIKIPNEEYAKWLNSANNNE